ncbi:Alpha-mannosidase [Aphelenchoides bicaudatus]|nr:Alpha-mannosidase [Aphelenchoides bicaudatus]
MFFTQIWKKWTLKYLNRSTQVNWRQQRPYQLSFNAELLPFTAKTYLIRKASKVSKKRILVDNKVNKSSGAYIFRPNDTSPEWVGKPFRVEFVKGKTFQEVRQLFNSWVSQTIRLEDNSDLLEFQFLIGPIPKESKNPVAKEVISRFNVTGIKSANTFYTDSNGRQMMERKLGVSPTFKRENTEPVAGNLYPVASTIYIRDKEHQMAVSTDRSQAGGSFGDGNIDLMIHRRCFHDDNFGVDEALDEPGKDGRGLIISGSHTVQIGKITSKFRQTANDIYNKPIVAISSINNEDGQTIKNVHPLINELPEQVKILTLKLLNNGKVLLRLENFYQSADGKGSAHVDLTNLFTTMKINKVNEVSLANTKTIKRMSLTEAQLIELKPMEIRTFELEVQHL